MHRAVLYFLCSTLVLAQMPDSPVDAAIRAYWQSRGAARFEEAAARREEARRLLASVPPAAPQFAHWAQTVAHLYENAGMGEQARAVAEEALSRAGALGESHPARIMLLNTMANLWRQDRNLLKALSYLEKAAAASEAAPPPASPAPAPFYAPAPPAMAYPASRMGIASRLGIASNRITARAYAPGAPLNNGAFMYHQLAEMYRQLGRRDAAAAVLEKLREAAKDSPSSLASFYEREGRFEEAADLYKKEAEQGDPGRMAASLQALSGLYQRQERYADAAAVLQQAITALDASGKPEASRQTVWLRQSLAGIYQQAGQTEAAGQVYRQLLAENQDARDGFYLQILNNYAHYLGMTKRGAQAETLLKEYRAAHPNLQPGEDAMLLSALAGVARMSNQRERAEEYQRAAEEKQQSMMRTPPGQVSIRQDIVRAQSAANRNSPNEAFSLAMQAMDAAPRAMDRDQIAWAVPSIAAMVAQKSPDKAEQLYQRLFEILRSWSADTVQPLLSVLQQYPRFLMQQGRAEEVPAAIQRYRDALARAYGAGTGRMEEVLGMTVEFEQTRGSHERALAAARELLDLEESLNGKTSEPYLHAVERFADTCRAGNDSREAALRLQAVTLVDLVTPVNDARRGFARMNAALALARQGQFDEADRLAGEAMAIGQRLPGRHNPFAGQLQEIERMKTAPAPSNRWFNAEPPR